MARAVKLAQLVREFHVGSERLQVFDGPPTEMLPPIVRARQYDVLVVGACSHQPRLKTVFGTMTSRLVDATDGDVLLVKAPLPDFAPRRIPSVAEQRSYEREQLV